MLGERERTGDGPVVVLSGPLSLLLPFPKTVASQE